MWVSEHLMNLKYMLAHLYLGQIFIYNVLSSRSTSSASNKATLVLPCNLP